MGKRKPKQAADLPRPKMAKGEFIASVGGSFKVWLDWRDKGGCPWPEESDEVDLVAILRWLRDQVAAAAKLGPDKIHATRLKAAQADKAELELERLRGSLVDVDDVLADVSRVASRIREGIEELDTESQKVMLAKLEEAEAEFTGRE